MVDAETFMVEVVYLRPGLQLLIPVEVSRHAHLEEAIRRSGILARCPEIDLSKNRVGIFGKLAVLDQPLRAGDRIEIYRPLLADPKEVRKKRARQEGQSGQ
jgi:putative ubiquitin-RnfH superfamily antitoxin RatB of RatAB toxin-antitoxin module